jgi:hypothetical protein
MNNMTNNHTLFGESFDQLVLAIKQLGYDDVLYSFFPRPMYLNSKIQPVLQYSEGYAPFVSHYLENNYGNCDFILRLALEGRNTPIDWWEEIANGDVSPEEAEVTLDSRQKFGIQQGISIPVLSGSFAIAGISVISKTGSEADFKKLNDKSLEKLTKLASNYHTKIIMSQEDMRFFIEPLLERLNETKKKVLKHLLSNQPMKTIPETEGISQKYAEKVILIMRKEFGDISTNELLYILGMVHIHQYL